MSFLTQVRKGIYWFEAIFLPKIAVKVWNYFHTSNSHLNFCQLARQAALPEFKIEVWNSLNFWQIHHFEGLGNIWTGFVLPNLVPDWHFGTSEHTFEISTFGIWGGVFFEVGAPLVKVWIRRSKYWIERIKERIEPQLHIICIVLFIKTVCRWLDW